MIVKPKISVDHGIMELQPWNEEPLPKPFSEMSIGHLWGEAVKFGASLVLDEIRNGDTNVFLYEGDGGPEISLHVASVSVTVPLSAIWAEIDADDFDEPAAVAAVLRRMADKLDP